MIIRRFDPSACQFPRARLDLLPRLSRRSWARLNLVPRASVSQRWGGTVRHFKRARYALYCALGECGVGSQSAVLAPAYHCRTMLDGAVALGARIDLYRVQPDLAPDLDDIERRLATARFRALLAAHCFGRRQPVSVMQSLRALCDHHGCSLIEDCSHCLTETSGLPWPAGGQAPLADHVVASPYKFFGSADGGTLWTRGGLAPGTNAPAPARASDELRAALAAARDLLSTPATAPAAMGAAALNRDDLAPCGTEHAEPDNGQPSAAFDLRAAYAHDAAASRWFARRADHASIAGARRRHYVRLTGAARDWAPARALHDAHDADAAPYMFALLIDRCPQVFYALKRAGVPVGRWDEMAESDCGVARRYRLSLIHLPCHQQLGDADVEWMVGQLSRALRA